MYTGLSGYLVHLSPLAKCSGHACTYVDILVYFYINLQSGAYSGGAIGAAATR